MRRFSYLLNWSIKRLRGRSSCELRRFSYLLNSGPTGAGITGRYAVTVTENAFRGAWCHECREAKCGHVEAVLDGRRKGILPPVEPLEEKHWNGVEIAKLYNFPPGRDH